MSDARQFSLGHQFKAAVEPGGYGSALRVNGIEVPMVRSFSVKADIDGSSLEIECIHDKTGEVSGFIGSLKLSGTCFVVVQNLMPVAVFTDETAAHEFADKKRHGAFVIDVPLEVKA